MTESNNQPLVSSKTLDHEPDVEKARSSNGAVTEVVSTRTGLLDLPPEIRLIIFRHLLVRANSLPGIWSDDEDDESFSDHKVSPDLSILRTSKLIHREAFDVYYKENRFNCHFWSTPSPISQFPQIVNTMQNFKAAMYLGPKILDSRDAADFRKLTQLFGNHSVIRRNLVLELHIDPNPHSRKWLVKALGPFTNFRMINLRLYFTAPKVRHNDCIEWGEHIKTALEPVLGYAEEFEVLDWWRTATGLRFHPVDHHNQSRAPDDGDCDFLDGIRLG